MIRHLKQGLLVLLLTGAAQGARGQAFAPADQPWYVGAGAGTSFGQCTFRSITEYRIYWGAQGGVFGGYRLSRLVSLEAGVQLGAQTQAALNCCTYWLSEDGVRYMNPVLDQKGWYYHDMEARTRWGKLALQAKLDLLSLFTSPDCRWELNFGPQLGLVTTRNKLIAPGKEMDNARQWHFGLGGQASVGYRITDNIGAALYAGITGLGGERFDNLPHHAHDSNIIWDAGFKLAFSFGGKTREAPVAVVTIPPKWEPVPPVKEEEPDHEEPVVEEPVKEEPVVVEPVKPELVEVIPVPYEKTVYFANDSFRIADEYIPALEQTLDIMNRNPELKLEIHAYSSRSGGKDYNDKLSRLRMEEVQYWFVGRGIPLERLTEVYFHGVDYNEPSAEKARRAELRFVK